QARAAHEGHGGIEQLLLAVRKAAGRFSREMVELEEADHLVGSVRQPGIGTADQARGHVALMLLTGENQVLAHRKLWKDLQELEGAADTELVELGGTQARDDPAVELDLAA